MKNEIQEDHENIEYKEDELQFGYGASAVFLIFIAIVIYLSVIR